MVQEEAFDTWYGGKKQYDYGRFFEKDATHPEARKGDTWSDYDLRTMVERGKNNPAIVMWSIGNEVGEADGSDKSVATVRRLVKTIKEVDATRYVTMGADKFRFGAVSYTHLDVYKRQARPSYFIKKYRRTKMAEITAKLVKELREKSGACLLYTSRCV